MKAASSPQDQDIIELLERLKSFDGEYPPELQSARRAAFVEQIARHRHAGVREVLSSQDQGIIQLLETLGTQGDEYPSDLFAARRAALIDQIRQRDGVEIEEALPSPDQNLIEILQSFEPFKAEYPPDLLTSRRAAFLRQIAERNQAQEEMPLRDAQMVRGFANLKSVKIEYPVDLWIARRAAFLRQAGRERRMSLLDALRSAIQSWFRYTGKPPALSMKVMRTSLVVTGLLMATFVASLAYGNLDQLRELANLSTPSEEFSGPIPAAATSTHALVETVCKPGYSPPLCLAQEFDKTEDLTFQGNGARAAVAKDTLPGAIHRAGYVNDGFYGPGSSWVSNSAYSWLKIDLGKTTKINTVTFGKDRLGHNKQDNDPGQFVIAIALSDNIYAEGNSSNDYLEYTPVYNSKSDGFTGTVLGAETVQAEFGPVLARFVKITFTNARTVVDELQVFMLQPPDVLAEAPPERDRNPQRPTNTSAPLPTNTPLPTFTSTLVPTNTSLPTNTSTPIPTNTPLPTNTSTHVPTNTPIPPPTNTPIPPPTNTPIPPPTNTPVPPPTETPLILPIVPPPTQVPSTEVEPAIPFLTVIP